MAGLKPPIDWAAIPPQPFLRGDAYAANRDPAGHYHDGLFRVFHTRVHAESDGIYHSFTAVTESRDLINWSEPTLLTPKDRRLNYSSPGNVIRYGGEWVLCLQTYPMRGDSFGDDTARLFLMRSDDLTHWGKPELIPVKGPDVPEAEMGRMIDPYLLEDKGHAGEMVVLLQTERREYVVHGTISRRGRMWGRIDCGENVCVLVEDDEYVLFHSPRNGIGIKRSKDMAHWRDVGHLSFGQAEWEWAAGRLTAGHVLDLRHVPEIGKYIMFFHGSVSRAIQPKETHGNASLALAWSENLVDWDWPGRV